jgi:hypothetical protein
MVALTVVLAWIALSAGVALVIGPSLRRADARASSTDHLSQLPAVLTVEDVLGRHAPQPSH